MPHPLRMRYLNSLLYISLAAAMFALSPAIAAAQSNDQAFPTPVTRNEIRGRIQARPIGDSRLTQHYYVFDGEQGDIFVNIVAENFTGDIDIFIQEGLSPLSKIVFYADYQNNETGRVIYLRKRERILLRVQGRTPNDDPATYLIKFAGSFLAVNAADFPNAPALPTITRAEPARTVRPETVEARPQTRRAEPEPSRTEVASGEKRSATVARAEEKSPISGRDDTPVPETRTPETPRSEAAPETRTPAVPRSEAAQRRTAERETARPATPPARIFKLVIEFMDGSRIERPMTEVNRFSVEGDTLVVVPKGGAVRRYSMATVNRVAIE
ncbi:MAG: hypothetical protein IPM21_17805 [Acidobacteria bacterium]|nr:hypothetical protein [Acidobacteriota bacterium]